MTVFLEAPMEEEHPSVTALGAAIVRALHQNSNHRPQILEDRIAPRLIDPQSDFYRSRVEFQESLPEPARQRLEATIVMRSRYAEDCLAEAFGNGVRQYVLLGA